MGTHGHRPGEFPVGQSNTDNPDNWKLATAAKNLYGASRIRKTAHGRYVLSDFTTEEQLTIAAEAQRIKTVAIVDVLPKVFRLGTGRGIREQDPNLWKGTGSYTPSGNLITPKSVHRDIQKFLKGQFPDIKIEKALIDMLLGRTAWELKPEWTTPAFYAAIGKAICIRDEFNYSVGLMGLYPINDKAMNKLKRQNISYAMLDWAGSRKIIAAHSNFVNQTAQESLGALISWNN